MLLDHYTGLRVDAERGLVIGKRGLPIGTPNRDGYTQVGVFFEGKNRIFLAHRVVWEAVHGIKLGESEEVDHINFARSDNRSANLQVLSHADNVRRMAPEVRMAQIEATSKIGDDTVRAIRREVAGGDRKAEVARRHGISAWHVTRIVNRTSRSRVAA